MRTQPPPLSSAFRSRFHLHFHQRHHKNNREIKPIKYLPLFLAVLLPVPLIARSYRTCAVDKYHVVFPREEDGYWAIQTGDGRSSNDPDMTHKNRHATCDHSPPFAYGPFLGVCPFPDVRSLQQPTSTQHAPPTLLVISSSFDPGHDQCTPRASPVHDCI